MSNLLTGLTPPVSFEGNLNELAGSAVTGTGAVTASSAWYYVGAYCFQAAITSGASNDRAQGRLTVGSAANGLYYTRFYFRLTASGTYNDYYLLMGGLKASDDDIRSTAGYLMALVMQPVDRDVLIFYRDSTGIDWSQLSTGPLSLNTTYELQVLYDVSASNMAMRAWLDGVALLRSDNSQPVFTGTGRASPYTPDRLLLGVGSAYATAQNYATARFDAVRVEDAQIASGEYVRRPSGIWAPRMAPDGGIWKVRQ